MKKIVFCVIILLATLNGALWSEAIVLPMDTTLIFPDGKWQHLLTPMFLLSREDMESAALAMETVPIREKEVSDLKAAYHALEGKTLLIVGGTALGTALITTIVVLLAGR